MGADVSAAALGRALRLLSSEEAAWWQDAVLQQQSLMLQPSSTSLRPPPRIITVALAHDTAALVVARRVWRINTSRRLEVMGFDFDSCASR
jgi:hypothetical protein